VTTDTLLTLWEALAALCFFRLRAEEEESRSWRWTLGMWAALGLGFLTKGPPALLVAAPMLFSSVLAGERKTARRMFRPAGLAAFLLIGCSWYVAVAIKVPGVLSYWIEDEVLARVASGQYRRNAAWYGGFVVYVPALILGSLPWTGHLLTGLPSAGRHLIRFRDAEHRRAHPETLLLTCWLVLALAVFFAARSRMYLYVLPLFIPLSILVSMRLRQSSFRPAWRVLLVAWLLLLVASRAAVAAYPHDKDSRSLARAIERIVPFRPAEAVFVDTAPAYGLSLYLDCEVECVSIRRRRDPRYDSTLSSELLEKEERLIFLVRPGDFDKFADLCAVRGKHLRTLGTHGRYSVHAFESELVGQPETPPAAPAGPRGEAQTIP
jgi:4-amino-4-deoxy-L-arabinose transferase-like glycosyltransferase